jgi:hypothetical protein
MKSFNADLFNYPQFLFHVTDNISKLPLLIPDPTPLKTAGALFKHRPMA